MILQDGPNLLPIFTSVQVGLPVFEFVDKLQAAKPFVVLCSANFDLY